MRYKIIMLIHNIGFDNVYKISKDLWETNKQWQIIDVSDCFSKEFKDYIKNNKRILIMNDGECFKKLTTNEFISYCDKYNILPIFISDINNLDFPHLMYSNLEEVMTDSLEYIHADMESKVYKEFLNLTSCYLW